MIVKVHHKNKQTIVAVCDNDLLGKKFEEDGKQLDLTVDFYKGEEMTELETGDLIRNSDYVNLVGKKSVELGIEEGVIEKEHIIVIKGIPHAQAIVVHE